jgi:hypothetical protein
MCWLSPDQSSGPSGPGLELRYTRYKGKLMFWRANMPVLSMFYGTGSGCCGPTYRGWINEVQTFDADNVLQPGYAEPTWAAAGSPRLLMGRRARAYSLGGLRRNRLP